MSSTTAAPAVSSTSFELKTPKGTKDFGPYEMAIREKVFSTITDVFKRHGAVTIETPVFELREVLMGKYGEDSKLIYDLQDQGGEICSLRYDLTVPFARFLAMNKNIKTMKRYQIAKVYRRDQPVLTKGRFREFYQCDIDIAGGNYESMLPDAEVLKIIHEALSALLGPRNPFVVRCNNRKILDSIFKISGVPEDKFRTVCSSVDKLDKLSWAEVKQELVKDKGVSEQVADTIGGWVLRKGKKELIVALLETELASDALAKEGLEEMLKLFKFLEIFEVTENVVFDLSLARGLDYYTGAIFEAVLVGGDVGSIAGGGRYDELVGMFSKSGQKIPCVGMSLGIERIFTILEARAKKDQQQVKQNPVDVFVAAAGDDMLEERLSIVTSLWKNGIKAEFTLKRKVRPLDQFTYCEKNLIPMIVLLGPDEYKRGIVKIKNTFTRGEEEVEFAEVVSVLKAKLATLGDVEQNFDSQLKI